MSSTAAKEARPPLPSVATDVGPGKAAVPPPSQPAPAAGSSTGKPKPAAHDSQTPESPVHIRHARADTSFTWGSPAGLGIRASNDENLLIFRKAVGINYLPPVRGPAFDASATVLSPRTLEEGRRQAIGIYRSVLAEASRKSALYTAMTLLLYLCYFAQVVIGAALTALGSVAARYSTTITVLGALNTALAGVLALIRSSGQPQKLGKDQVGFRKLQDWIEETDALLAVGIIGRNRHEVGVLVEVAFRKYNAAKESEENNRADMYVQQPEDADSVGAGRTSGAKGASRNGGGADRRGDTTDWHGLLKT
ncbi:C6 transcription factor [Apiospora kogelbergensis]|uniref:C6 transcription factor n=1 Tax=Apiospora kogelbergensis TaxID=1337665 RepID=A0AAW0R2C4_9PEZI